ncbi:hypothetical protein D1J60_25655 [Streptomyces sp. W1SF4]|nr:hypothetical protein D1J60_25655 [Streptomyces sp. W1SF4]
MDDGEDLRGLGFAVSFRMGWAGPPLVGLLDLLGDVPGVGLDGRAGVDAPADGLVVLAVDDVLVDGVEAVEEGLSLGALGLGGQAGGGAGRVRVSAGAARAGCRLSGAGVADPGRGRAGAGRGAAGAAGEREEPGGGQDGDGVVCAHRIMFAGVVVPRGGRDGSVTREGPARWRGLRMVFGRADDAQVQDAARPPVLQLGAESGFSGCSPWSTTRTWGSTPCRSPPAHGVVPGAGGLSDNPQRPLNV